MNTNKQRIAQEYEIPLKTYSEIQLLKDETLFFPFIFTEGKAPEDKDLSTPTY